MEDADRICRIRWGLKGLHINLQLLILGDMGDSFHRLANRADSICKSGEAGGTGFRSY